MMQKRHPIKVIAEKYQIVPWTCRGEFIMNSNVTEISIKFMYFEATAKPIAASTVTSGTNSHATLPYDQPKEIKKKLININANKFHCLKTLSPQKKRSIPIAN